MKLRNKKTGEIDDFIFEVITDRIDLYRRVGHSESKNIWHYDSLAELNTEWCDYEEPKEHWFVSEFGKVYSLKHIPMDKEKVGWLKQNGNYFETEEEAEKAVEKLKAWKRLKEARFAFGLPEYTLNEVSSIIGATGSVGYSCLCYEDFEKDLDLLFGGEK